MTLYLKGHEKYNRSKLKVLDLLNKNRTFNFDQLYFWCPLRYRVIQYLIWKLLWNGKMESWRLGCGNISIFCYMLFKNLIVVLKMGFAWFVFATIVLRWLGFYHLLKTLRNQIKYNYFMKNVMIIYSLLCKVYKKGIYQSNTELM